MIDWDIEPLPETLALRPLEMPVSLISRIAAMNDAGNARQFCRDFYLNFERIQRGEPSELQKLSILTGADFNELVANAPVATSNAHFMVRGEPLTTGRSRKTRMRICPFCANADLEAAPGLRGDAAIAWRLPALVAPLRTCFEHAAAYVQISTRESLGDHHGDYSLMTGELLDDIAGLVAQSIRRAVSAFELYIMGRLSLSERVFVPLLDALDITDVTKICERFGVFVLFGRKALLNVEDEDRCWAAAQAGFEVLSKGGEGIRQFVTRAFEGATEDQRLGMSNTIFGKLHYFLNSELAADKFIAIKQIIADRLCELLPYGPDNGPLFGVPLRKRRWHTLVSAEREYGIAYRTIRRIVLDAGLADRLNPNFAHTRFVIDAAKLHDLLTSPETLLYRHEVIERTGAKATDFAVFEAAGLLVPRSRGNTLKENKFRRGDVLRVERKLLGQAAVVNRERPDYVTIWQAYTRSAWLFREVIEHIVARRLPTSSVAGQKSIASLRVHLPSLLALHPLHGKRTLSIEGAAKLLRINEAAVLHLTRSKRMPVYKIRNAETGALRLHLLHDDVQAFGDAHIPLSEVWRRTGRQLPKVRGWLSGHGIQPVLEFKRNPPVTFYRRSQVEPLIV